ncbi:DUF3467 domain-containing protein [bacterium]|nr:DUF3467 domain-containing protein [bacterium]MBU1872098.1 DUF3467 domain-containing protein [bacterium]
MGKVSDNIKTSTKVEYSSDFEVKYSNFAQFTITDKDMAIDIGIRHIHDGIEDVSIFERLMLSPQHAKIFCSKMQGLINHFEENIGAIPTELKKK